jgi:hypothetical protein
MIMNDRSMCVVGCLVLVLQCNCGEARCFLSATAITVTSKPEAAAGNPLKSHSGPLVVFWATNNLTILSVLSVYNHWETKKTIV